MQELDKRIGLLRLLLADIDAREQQRAALSKQYRLQMQRVVEATVSQAGDLAAALTVMQEVEERLAEVERAGRHLGLLRTRAATELEALLLTRRIAEAQAQLAELEIRQQTLAEQLAELRPAHAISAGGTGGESRADDPPVSEEEAALRALNEEVRRDIARLHRLILDASERAARTITPGT